MIAPMRISVMPGTYVWIGGGGMFVVLRIVRRRPQSPHLVFGTSASASEEVESLVLYVLTRT